MFMRNESLKQYVKLYPVISIILIVNIMLFVAMEVTGSSSDNSTLLRFGALYNIHIPGAPQPEPWRFVSAMFLHIGFMHFLMNSFALYIFAAPLERMLGAWRFAVLYLISGIIGSIASYLLHPDSYIGAGASGAIYGLYAAYFYISVFFKEAFGKENTILIRTILIIGVIHSIAVPGVDLYAHAGGFAGGFLVTAFLAMNAKLRSKRRGV